MEDCDESGPPPEADAEVADEVGVDEEREYHAGLSAGAPPVFASPGRRVAQTSLILVRLMCSVAAATGDWK